MEFNLLPEKKTAKSAHYAISLTSTPPGRPVSLGRGERGSVVPVVVVFIDASSLIRSETERESIWSKSDLYPPSLTIWSLKQKSIQSKRDTEPFNPGRRPEFTCIHCVCVASVCVLIWSISSHWACNNFAPSLSRRGSILNSSCCLLLCVSRPEKRTREKI